jgi:polyphosphate glucokinase
MVARQRSRRRSRTGETRDGKERGTSAKKILVVDIGGSKIKILATGRIKPRKIPSSKNLSPIEMVQAVQKLAKGWDFDAVSIGYPGLVGDNGPRSEPWNLGSGWVGFNFAAAFGLPVKIINDAAMQALGSYEGGRMLFLGLGTGLGSTLIAENVVVPLELGQLKYDGKESFGDAVGKGGLRRLGKKAWRRAVVEIATTLADALVAENVVLGGGNAKQLGVLPHGMRVGGNQTPFRGGFRLWHLKDIRTHSAKTEHHAASSNADAGEWRVI